MQLECKPVAQIRYLWAGVEPGITLAVVRSALILAQIHFRYNSLDGIVYLIEIATIGTIKREICIFTKGSAGRAVEDIKILTVKIRYLRR